MSRSVTGCIRIILRAEGAAVLCAALFFYHSMGYGWTQFAWWFLIPDMAFIAYLISPRAGALAYNTTHTYLIPIALFAASHLLNHLAWMSFATIWMAHIGFDRMLGYGLKYATAFADTHLGTLGKKR